MVLRTESLIRENLDSKYRVHIARLRALQYQIQPHFLYNSIFLIYRMAQMDENEPIADYAEHLGKYYQYITRVSDRKVKISQEIEHIRNYLAIQETRFGGQGSALFWERFRRSLRMPNSCLSHCSLWLRTPMSMV